MSPGSSASPAVSGRTLLLARRLGAEQEVAVRRAREAGWDVLSAEDLPLPSFEDGGFVAGAFDLTEHAVAALLSRRPGVGRALQRLTRSSDVDRYLCRSLFRETGDLLALALLVSRDLGAYERVVVERHWPNGPDFAFIAAVARSERPPLPEPVVDALHRLSFQSDEEPAARRVARSAAQALRELAQLWLDCVRLVRPRAMRLPRRPLLIRSYVEDWGIDRGAEGRLRNLDFVVDGETIKPADVGVWLEHDVPGRTEELLARGYGTASRSAVAFGPVGFVTRVLPALLSASAVAVRLAAAERWWHAPLRRLALETIVWGEVGRSARPRVFLALNDTHPVGVARTLALRRVGCLTVEYEFSSHWLTTEQAWVPDYVYGFTVLDAVVSWGPLHSEHFRNHRGRIREFWEVGCLWSEHARLVRDDPALARRYREAAGVDPAAYDHVVGVFDTSTASFFPADAMLDLYAGIADVARRFPRVLFLCKPKRPPKTLFASTERGSRVEGELAAAPNVVLLPQPFETAAVVGFCDLSVNACFTSTAVETIGIGRPALYYDAAGLFPDSFLRGLPGLVVDDADELAAAIEQLLALDAAGREADLRARLAPLEGHFDGLAITRLRRHLRDVLDR